MIPRPAVSGSFARLRGLFAALLLVALAATTRAADLPTKPREILPLDGVKIGMKGYGLTVFEGAKIEPFTVEVVSVMRDFAPQRGVVWVRCPEPRMQKTGPVAGMSGSPIYLWADGEKQEPGQGGKLIGAFAFGHRATKDCYVGVRHARNSCCRILAQASPAGRPLGRSSRR